MRSEYIPPTTYERPTFALPLIWNASFADKRCLLYHPVTNLTEQLMAEAVRTFGRKSRATYVITARGFDTMADMVAHYKNSSDAAWPVTFDDVRLVAAHPVLAIAIHAPDYSVPDAMLSFPYKLR